jgi:hypothetical protein
LVLLYPSFEGRRSLADTEPPGRRRRRSFIPIVVSIDDACCVNINSSSLCGFS